VNEETGTADAVDVFVHSPLTMRAIYSEENTRKIEYVIHAWQRSDGFLRADLYYPRAGDGIERWVSIKEFGDLRGPDGTLSITYEEGMFEELPADDGEGEDADPGGHVDNPYERVPIFHARTSRPYGRPEHKDAYGPQNALNKLVASHLSAVDWYVWPWRFALSKTGTTGPDLNDWNKDNRQVPARGGAASDRSTERGRMRPGTLNKLHNTDAVGQLDAAPASNFLDPIGAYIRILGEVTDTPMSGIDRTGAAESGESRKAHLDGLLSAVENLQLVARGPLVDAMEFALTVLGEPDQDVNLAWKPTAEDRRRGGLARGQGEGRRRRPDRGGAHRGGLPAGGDRGLCERRARRQARRARANRHRGHPARAGGAGHGHARRAPRPSCSGSSSRTC
jgi:hypothetical protein